MNFMTLKLPSPYIDSKIRDNESFNKLRQKVLPDAKKTLKNINSKLRYLQIEWGEKILGMGKLRIR